MRLSDAQAEAIRRTTLELAGSSATVRLFGSRLDDGARGGDVDLLGEAPQPVGRPAWLAAPNLSRLPIHELALRTGRLL